MANPWHNIDCSLVALRYSASYCQDVKGYYLHISTNCSTWSAKKLLGSGAVQACVAGVMRLVDTDRMMFHRFINSIIVQDHEQSR